MYSRRFCIALIGLLSPLLAAASEEVHNVSETGALSFYSGAGWSFGLPSVQTGVSVGGLGTAVSPIKKVLPMYNLGVGLRAWKFLVPFMDFSVIDTGKASAQVGSFSSTAQANTFALNGGIRIIGRASRFRPYAEIGGGFLHQNLKTTVAQGDQSYSGSASGSVPDIMYGGGVQVFFGKKWGSDFGFDGYHVTQPFSGGGQNYSAMRFGIFYQTKSSSQ